MRRYLPHVYVSPGAMVGIGVSWLALVAVFVWLATTAATVNNLDKTDRIACQFLRADAAVRRQQSTATRDSTLSAESAFIKDANAFLKLFNALPPEKDTTGVMLFEDYVTAERNLIISIRDGTRKNVALSQHIAKQASGLADRLDCEAH